MKSDPGEKSNSIVRTSELSWKGYFLSGVLLVVLSVILMAPAGTAQIKFVQDNPDFRIDTQAAIDHLRNEWNNRNISRLEVLHISTNTVFRMNVSSSVMDGSYGVKLIVRECRQSANAAEIVSLLSKARISHSGHVADLRWAFIFYSADNKRAISVYFDESGKNGVIDGACVAFESDALLKWAQTVYGSAFQ